MMIRRNFLQSCLGGLAALVVPARWLRAKEYTKQDLIAEMRAAKPKELPYASLTDLEAVDLVRECTRCLVPAKAIVPQLRRPSEDKWHFEEVFRVCPHQGPLITGTFLWDRFTREPYSGFTSGEASFFSNYQFHLKELRRAPSESTLIRMIDCRRNEAIRSLQETVLA